MKNYLSIAFGTALITGLHAQAPSSIDLAQQPPAASTSAPAPAAASAPAAPPAPAQQSTMPQIDPSNNVVSWDGQHWNIANQTLFRARFEKFLNAPEQTDAEYAAYQAVMDQISAKLDPVGYTPQNLDDAWALLQKASTARIDSGLSGALADVVHTAWLAQGEQARLKGAEAAAREARKDAQWDLNIALEDNATQGEMDSGSRDKDKSGKDTGVYADEKSFIIANGTQDIAEATGDMTTAKAQQMVTIIQAKLEFQSFILQLFMQRRFQHVVIAANFYRNLFGDGDTKLQVSQKAQDALTGGSGLPATIGVLETLSVAAEGDAKEGAEATIFLMGKNRLNAATEQMQQAFVEGEYLPDLRNIPRDQKVRIADYVEKENDLLTAIDSKDYATAETETTDLKAMASDFDATKPMSAITAAKTGAALHLAKAQNAAAAGDNATFESELKAAGDLWPSDPDLTTVASAILKDSNLQQKTLNDFDALYAQKNFRQIWDNKAKLIAATARDDTRQKQLNDVLSEIQEIEMVIARSQELEKRGDSAGAWEGVETESEKYDSDPKLNQLRAQLTTEAAEFVHAIQTARDLEKRDEWGSAVAWYLKAQGSYPSSEFAQDGIDSITKKVMAAN